MPIPPPDPAHSGISCPAHLRPAFIGVVILGGMLGVGAREGLALAFPTTGIPWTIGAINISGAFLLGFLLELLVHVGPDTGGRRLLRLFAGPGVLGGFTTYSALATDTASLTADGPVFSGIGYALGSVILGVLAAGAGTVIADQWRPRALTTRIHLTDMLADTEGAGNGTDPTRTTDPADPAALTVTAITKTNGAMDTTPRSEGSASGEEAR